MKVCKFCGTENPDSVTSCSACGGNEFKYVCGNCGNVFDEGKFCPNCGVKAGSRAKHCPNCGKEYYSAACPDCGYTPDKASSPRPANHTTVVYTTPAPQPVKKRRTWLWVLGWICIFPVPLTILITRNKNMDQKVKTGIIAAAWILYLLIAAFGDTDSSSASVKQAPQTVVSEAAWDTLSVDLLKCQTGTELFCELEIIKYSA